MVWISKFGFAPLALMFGLNLILWIFWGFSWIFFILLILTALLFRTPRRSVVCEDKKAILAPMDSEILKIENVKHKDFGECMQVSFKNALYNAGAIFASSDFETFDIKARHGLFLSPKFELASAFNERLLIIAQKGSQSFGIRLMAGSFDRKIKLKNEKNIVAILSGGNIDSQMLNIIIEKGLFKAHRKMLISVTLVDKPGALLALSEVLKEAGANIIKIDYDRFSTKLNYGDAMISITLETKGKEHQELVRELLKKNKFIFSEND